MSTPVASSTPLHDLAPLPTRQLWKLFAGKRFARYSPHARERLVHMITSRATSRYRHELDPDGALAACILWYLGDATSQRLATKTLRALPLPADLTWQIKLTRQLPPDVLLELCRLCMEERFFATAASLASASLIHHVALPPRIKPESARLRACDLVSQCAPARFRQTLELLADATTQGNLDFAWLEWPLRAAIRLNIDNPPRQQALRDFYASQPFDTSLPRTARLYTPIIQAEHLAHQQLLPHHILLLEHATHLLTTHPRRAQHLLELAAIFEQRSRGVTLMSKLRRALARYTTRAALEASPIPTHLARLYVRHHAIEPSRARLVATIMELAPHLLTDAISPEDLQTYILISHHDRPFEHLSCTYEGVRLAMVDKDPATRVTYYVESRPSPRLNAQFFDLVMAPVGWIQHTLRSLESTRHIAHQLLIRHIAHHRQLDQSAMASTLLRSHDATLDAFDDISTLPIELIEHATAPIRRRYLLAAALAGALSTASTQIGPGQLAALDAPLMIVLMTRYCHALCWLYGFDPEAYPDIVDTILHVTIWGPRYTRRYSHEELIEALEDLFIRKSLITSALTRGAINTSSLYLIRNWIEEQASSPALQKALGFSQNLLMRAPSPSPSDPRATSLSELLARSLPGLGVTLSALLNVALLYDLFEASQAVLTDQFLVRKYPQWEPHFSPSSSREQEGARS